MMDGSRTISEEIIPLSRLVRSDSRILTRVLRNILATTAVKELFLCSLIASLTRDASMGCTPQNLASSGGL